MHPELTYRLAQLRHDELHRPPPLRHGAAPGAVAGWFARRRRDLPDAACRRTGTDRPPPTSPGSTRRLVATSVSPDRPVVRLPAALRPAGGDVVAASSVDDVLSGRVGMSPVMVGRARPFARLAGIVDAAEVMTGDQPSVALVSGEPGHRQDAPGARAGRRRCPIA